MTKNVMPEKTKHFIPGVSDPQNFPHLALLVSKVNIVMLFVIKEALHLM